MNATRPLRKPITRKWFFLAWSCAFAQGCATTPARKNDRDCIVAIVGPVKSDVPGLDELIERKWREKVAPKLRTDCDRLVPREEAIHQFALLNQSNEDGLEMDKIGTRQMAILRERTGATHLIQLTYKQLTEGINVDSRVWDVRSDIPALERNLLQTRVLIPARS